MSYPKGKHVIIDPDHPKALGICDATGFVFRHCDLVKQMEWRGNALTWTGFMVGKPYVDTPNEQLRVPLLRPDPIPIALPRGQQPSNVVWSNQSVPWNQLEVLNWSSWGGTEDGVLAATEAQRLESLQTGNPPPTTSVSGGTQQPPELTQAQILESLQNFNWGV